MKKYKILEKSDAKALERDIKQLAEHGWTVVNVSVSVSIYQRVFVAAMVKEV